MAGVSHRNRYTESLEDTAEDTIHRLISAGVNNILSRLNLPTVKASKPAGNTLSVPVKPPTAFRGSV